MIDKMSNAGISATFHYLYGDKYLFSLAVLSCFVLFLFFKNDRRRLIWPMIFCLLAVLNPYAYKIAGSIGIYWYWRLFWMFAEGVITALAFTRIIQFFRKKIRWPILFSAMCLLIGLLGEYVFQEGNFYKADNPDKLKLGTEEVCDALLAVDPNPRVVLCFAYTPYVRQYSGDITLFYDRYDYEYQLAGREVEHKVAHELEKTNPDYRMIFSTALENDYNFVVTYGNRPVPEDIYSAFGFEEVGDDVGVFIFYNPEL
ncbi:MAG: hypothetical protein K6E30_05570 [Lachnospiraceae bacterium]|nr:hypothetical protein [Lachnospiraceae bacterium]